MRIPGALSRESVWYDGHPVTSKPPSRSMGGHSRWEAYSGGSGARHQTPGRRSGLSAFKAYDIRGVYNRDFDKETVYRIGFFLPKLLNADRVMVGFDARASTPEIFEALCRGINDQGATVVSIGLATTPMVYFATARHGFDASVQITASHNPPEYNGLKVSRTRALPVGYDTGLQELERMVAENTITPVENRGSVEQLEVKPEYIEFLSRYAPDMSGLKVGIDCSNGMAALLIRDILGDTPHYIYDTLDGTFPNHEPNPLIEENVEDLKTLVRENSLDIGVIFDGDADRVMFVDENARFIRPDLLIGILGLHYLEGAKDSATPPRVLHDIRTSKAVARYIESLGGEPHMWKVGHSHAKVKLKELDAVFGGELAGYYYFRDFFNCDSGILASLIILSVTAKLKDQKNQPFSVLIDAIGSVANSGEINFRLEDKEGAMEALKARMTADTPPEAVYDFDGYRVEFKDWWFNVRPSNTEPYLRLIAEADSQELLDGKLEEMKGILNEFMES